MASAEIYRPTHTKASHYARRDTTRVASGSPPGERVVGGEVPAVGVVIRFSQAGDEGRPAGRAHAGLGVAD